MAKIVTINVDASMVSNHDRYPRSYEGVRIVLDNGEEIFFGINMASNCCEQYDYLHSVDDPEEFVGATFVRLDEKDTWPENVGEEEPTYWDCGGFQAIDIVTDCGVMQFVVYNSHNGYYSHATILKQGDKIETDYL